MTSSSRAPRTWEEYEYGRSPSQTSVGSDTGDSHPKRISPTSTAPYQGIPSKSSHEEAGQRGYLGRRRSSLSLGINSIRQIGGVNSIDNFARSWQRAAGFHEITPVRQESFTVAESDETDDDRRIGDEEQGARLPRSLLGQQLRQHGRPPEVAIDEDQEGSAANRERQTSVARRLPSEGTDIFSLAPHLASPLSHSYGTSYGSLSSRVSDSARMHAARLYQEQQVTGAQPGDKERQPLLMKQVEREDGTKTQVVIGQSTLPQTIFNSVNTLIGVGLLSLPLGIKYAGWLAGLIFLSFAAIVTGYTAKLLATCLNVEPSLVTYADVAYIAFGNRARLVTSIFFSLELIAACVALVVLFADSMDALLEIPGVGTLQWKILCGIILIPLNFVPLRLLSISSILGIFCCTSLVLIVLVDGFIKPHSPGSLRQPAVTYLFPQNWSTLPLSFGLLMSPWGGHSVFPNIYRDMRHPQKYNKGLRYTYGFTYSLDLTMAVGGLVMFGNAVREEITSNILLTDGYPRPLSILIVVLIAIIPLTKIPLSCRPIVSTCEILLGLDPRVLGPTPGTEGMSALTRGVMKIFLRVFVIFLIVLIATLFPDFDSIMALMGSCLCFTICVILPVSFYLKIFGNEISPQERALDWILIIACTAMAAVGTVWAFLPKEKVGIT